MYLYNKSNMGNQQSASSIKTSVTDIISKNMLNSFTKNLNEQSSQCSGNQYAEIKTGPGSIINCSIDLTQQMALDCKAQGFFTSQNENSLKANIQNSLDQSFKSDQKQENPSFTLVPYSSQNSSDSVNVQNYIKNIVERNLTSENLNKCLAIAKGVQKGVVTLEGTVNCPANRNYINVTQDLVLQQYAQCGADIINKTITDDKFIDQLATTAASSQSNLTSSYGIIIIVIVIILCIILFLYLKSSSSGQSITVQKN